MDFKLCQYDILNAYKDHGPSTVFGHIATFAGDSPSPFQASRQRQDCSRYDIECSQGNHATRRLDMLWLVPYCYEWNVVRDKIRASWNGCVTTTRSTLVRMPISTVGPWTVREWSAPVMGKDVKSLKISSFENCANCAEIGGSPISFVATYSLISWS